MKRVLLVFMLFAAGCSKSTPYDDFIRSGMSPEQAKAAAKTVDEVNSLPNQAELDYRVGQKRKQIEQIHDDMCKKAPYERSCS